MTNTNLSDFDYNWEGQRLSSILEMFLPLAPTRQGPFEVHA